MNKLIKCEVISPEPGNVIFDEHEIENSPSMVIADPPGDRNLQNENEGRSSTCLELVPYNSNVNVSQPTLDQSFNSTMDGDGLNDDKDAIIKNLKARLKSEKRKRRQLQGNCFLI